MSASKREELVHKALTLFYKNGFTATGMDKLARETGVSKATIYKHFQTKEGLILAVLRLRDTDFRKWLTRRIETLASTPKDQLLALFDALEEWFAQDDFRSCLFIKASSEFQDRSHPAHAIAAEHKMLLLAYLKNLTQQAGITHPASDTLAEQILLLKEGAIVMAHLHTSKGIALNARLAATVLIEKALEAPKEASQK